MIPRYQAVLFAILLAASVIMGVVLWQLRERAHQRLLQGHDSAPTQAPQVAPAEQATLLVASDPDNSLLTQLQTLPLPQDPGSRARVILGKLLDLYAAPGAAHPVPGGAASIAQVFLLPAPELLTNPVILSDPSGAEGRGKPALSEVERGPAVSSRRTPGTRAPLTPNPAPPNGPLLAVVNLTGSFVASHPSGLEAENLTLQSICGTLHANLPRVTQVRFLVDGQQRATLAGHADLTRAYLAADAAPQP